MIFSILDWCILAICLVGMVAIGFCFASRQVSTREFFLGGQRFGSLAIFTAWLSLHLNKSVRMAVIKSGSLFMGAMLGAFLPGMLSPSATSRFAFRGCILGVFAAFAAGFATPSEIFWLTMLGTVTTLLAGFLISLVPPASGEEVARATPLTVFGWRKGS